MMDNRCGNCRWFTNGMTDEQRKTWGVTNWGHWADGVCSLYFPRGYLGRKPPHPARSNGHCFQWEPREDGEQMEIESDG